MLNRFIAALAAVVLCSLGALAQQGMPIQQAYSVAAAGTTQGTATHLYAVYNHVGTVAAGAGVVLPTFGAIGTLATTVVNQGANPLIVYAPSGAMLNGVMNGSVTLATGASARFTYTSAMALNAALDAAAPVLIPAFYVSAAGNDSNPGTLASPFLTLGKCQTAMQQPGAVKTCYVRGGSYSMSAGLSLDYRDQGETWSSYPGDTGPLPAVGAALSGEPVLTQVSAFPYFNLAIGADQVTITGFNTTGFEHTEHASCNSGPSQAEFVKAIESAPALNDLTVTHNTLSTFDCGIGGEFVNNPVFSYNYLTTVEYAGIYCDACNGRTGQSVWTGNVIYDTDPDGTGSTNAYPITMSKIAPGYYTTNITIENNIVVNNPTWECLDEHSGAHNYFINNLCVGITGNTNINATSISTLQPLANIVVAGNVFDRGNVSALIDTVAMCADTLPCSSSSSDITGGLIANNTMLMGTGNGCVIAANSSVVTISNNNGHTPCSSSNGLAVETISSINFAGSTSATFTHGQPNAVVATLNVNMSASYWQFPFPPGALTIGGTNSGGFVICNYNQICQPSSGTAVGTYNDFSITATLHSMSGSPVTISAGTLSLTGS